MSLSDLTRNAISLLYKEDGSQNGSSICQVLTLKKVASTNETVPDRYRAILSDGDYYAPAMLATQLKPLIDTDELRRNSLIKLTSYTISTVQGRRLIILLTTDVVGQAEDRIGTPQAWEKKGETGGGSGPVKQEENRSAFADDGGAGKSNAAPRTGTTRASMADVPIYPIEALSPYQNKFTIKARVTSKSEIKHWSNQKGEGKLFSCNLLDESSEIKATAFNDQVDRWYNVLKEGHVYYITRGRITIARKQFSTLKNEYEIAFERDTQIVECDDASDVPEVKFDFKPLDQLEGVEPKQTCDVIAVVENVGDVSEIITKATQKPYAKRDLTLLDHSGMTVKLTLWGKTAETYGTPSGHVGCGVDDKPVIAFKGVSVSDFGGRSLSMLSSATMAVNPDIPEAHGLRGWYDTEGIALSDRKELKSYSIAGMGGVGAGFAGGDFNPREKKTIQQAKDENLGLSGDKPDYFHIKATITHLRHENLYYPGCPGDGCNKKVTYDESSGSWRCEKCDRSFEAPEYRYIISANVQDATGQFWLSGFNDVGEQMLGISANEYNARKDEGEDSELSLILMRAANKTYQFKIRAKSETFNDSPRIRYTITKMVPIDFVQAGNELAEAIKKYL